MAKEYTFKFKSEPEAVISKYKELAKKNNVDFSGDATGGKFSVMGVEGQYAIQAVPAQENLLTITIDKKPMLIPWGLVDKTINEFFA